MVGIDRVYQTVQKILNKEQRGYLPPVEFNLFANQAQNEIFEGYFSSRNYAVSNDSDYSDIRKNVEEKMSLFDNEETVSSGTFTNAAGNVTANHFPYPSNFYRLGSVTADVANVPPCNITEVSNKDLVYVNKSPLTKPTTRNPVYTRHEAGIVVHPTTGISNVTYSYVRIPAEVNWGYTTVNSKPLYNAATSTNFQLHGSESTELVLKICQYAGLSTKSMDVAQAATQKDQQLTQSEK
jgi:hypothetical protein